MQAFIQGVKVKQAETAVSDLQREPELGVVRRETVQLAKGNVNWV